MSMTNHNEINAAALDYCAAIENAARRRASIAEARAELDAGKLDYYRHMRLYSSIKNWRDELLYAQAVLEDSTQKLRAAFAEVQNLDDANVFPHSDISDCEGNPLQCFTSGWINALESIREGVLDPKNDAEVLRFVFSAVENQYPNIWRNRR